MISHDQIKSFATKLQTTEINIYREYIQHVFLHNLYMQQNSEKLLFKGGTALKLTFASPRFSEDLDFDLNAPKFRTAAKIQFIEDILMNTLTEITRSNIFIDLLETKLTSGGYLSVLRVKTENNPVNIQVEASFRNTSSLESETILISSTLYPAYTIQLLAQDLLINGKLHALQERKKPRDYFDLYFLLRSSLIRTSQRSVLGKIKQTIPNDANFFAHELLEFLPISYHGLIRRFPETLKQEISRYV